MKALEISSEFDNLIFDAKGSNYLIIDVLKFLMEFKIKNIIVKNWTKDYINKNHAHLKLIMRFSHIKFDFSGRTASDASFIQDFLNNNNKLNNGALFYNACFAPWIVQNGVMDYVWSFDNVNSSLNSRIKSYSLKINENCNLMLAFSDNKNGLIGSNIDSFENISNLDSLLFSNFNSKIFQLTNSSMAYCLTLNNLKEIKNIDASFYDRLSFMGFNSILFIDLSNINKYEVSWDEYIHLKSVPKNFKVLIYGLPISRESFVSKDVGFFKWVVPNVINEKDIEIIKKESNSEFYLL